ncbi:MAG: nicotinate-nucleotide adenylyltransferase [Xanthomonadales bacterium]|jgi:nicotinate-nucleotide adenylyltransferase|nr:nicotinate-nucleotide adenylyltransferase [Xanthomonadales bacterium]
MNFDPDPLSLPIGVFGGTFDPVHYGHLRPALEVFEQLGLAQVRMLPAARPPHRVQPGASARHRLAMLELAIAGENGLVADDCELRREGPSFMVDTLRELKQCFPAAPLVLVIGQDAANGLDRWHQWRCLFELAHIVVMRRPDAREAYSRELAQEMNGRLAGTADQLRQQAAGCVLPLQITQLDISASAIRAMIGAGRSAGFLTPREVLDYIREQRLYA